MSAAEVFSLFLCGSPAAFHAFRRRTSDLGGGLLGLVAPGLDRLLRSRRRASGSGRSSSISLDRPDLPVPAVPLPAVSCGWSSPAAWVSLLQIGFGPFHFSCCNFFILIFLLPSASRSRWPLA